MLKDFEIRQALIRQIEKENQRHKNSSYRIIEELSVCDGEARVDIAVANGRLCGYEIKSDADTFDRLPNQISCYNTTFDKMTIVVGKKYTDKVKDVVPEWWGIKIAYINKFGNVSITNIRSPKVNKELNAYRLTQLLWKEEMLNILKENNIKGISNKSRYRLREIASEQISLNEIKDYVRDTIKARTNWREDPQ